jgi:RNA polymerase sigma-70 factor (sigma-E family)
MAREGRALIAPEVDAGRARSPSSGGADGRDIIARLYESERHRLLRLAVLFVGDRATAEDLVQDAFAALQRRWRQLADPDRAAGYLSASVANGARSHLRRDRAASRRPHRVDGPDPDPAGAPTLLADEHERVAAAVRRLPRRQQQVIALRYWSGLREIQIAEALGISAGTVKSTAARALASLTRALETDDA